jgi:DNA-binding XRE family transcriptional regulator/predicted RNase H-like HicB family nuclease
MKYVAEVHREGSHWLAEFPDAPGCQTFADSALALRAAAADALSGWLEAHLVAGDAPPRPTPHKGSKSVERWEIPISARLSAALLIRWRRQELGLSQRQLAQRLKVSQQQIAKLENPDENPTLATLERAAAALGMRFSLDASLMPL